MKSLATVLCSVLLLVALGHTQVCADELDELLAGKVPATEQPPATQRATEAVQAATGDTLAVPSGAIPHDELDVDYTDHSHWQPVVALPSGASTIHGNSQAAEAPSAFSAVPEPSAIALAVLALVYFLIFGRRRFAA